MNNRVNDPQETERIIIRNLSQKTGTANTASIACIFFSFDRSQFLSQAAPRSHFVDISAAIVEANKSKSDSASRLETKFREYANKWYAETMRDSSISRMTSNVNYLNVIKLGPDVVPLILRELQSDPAPWFLALRVLTEETKVGVGYAGNFEKIAEAWVSWGKDRGLI